MQQRLKSAARSARAWIVATEFFDQFLVRAHDAKPALYMGFGREASAALATDLESNWIRGVLS